jgi:acetylornithine deacetylase
VDERFDGTVEFLRELVCAPSLICAEESAQAVVERRMLDMGFSVESVVPDVEQLAAQPESGSPLHPYEGRRNLVGQLAGSGAGVVTLNGHVDVVTAEPHELWEHDPYGGEIHDGRMYGRGAADMKGGVAAMLLAIEAAHAVGPPSATVVYQSVIEEETTGNGALTAGLASPAPGAALIAEPTNGGVYVAAVGVTHGRVTITGPAGHALSADQRVNPIDEAYGVIAALRELEAQLNAAPDPEFADVEHPYVLNIGALHAGDMPSSTPAEAQLDFRLGIPRSLTPAAAMRRVEEAVARVSPGATVSLRGQRAHGYAFDPEAPFVRLLRDTHEEVHGAPPLVGSSKGGNDLRFFERPFRVPGAACYGPTGGAYHGLDEWVDLASIADVATVMALVLLRWN